ncbi:MAG: ferrous iron transport protein A [Flavobacteriales bacterium]|nr:ferrous iron transport protein A [Flavobacteriales bacterium]
MKEGTECEIIQIKESEISVRLMELGCLPGMRMKLIKKSHFGGPLLIEVDNVLISVGVEESKAIEIGLN